MPKLEQNQQGLVRGLNLTDTTSLVIGTIIGTGVFMKASVMAQQAGTPTLVILAWVVVWRYSTTAAVVMSVVAAAIPPVAVIVVNAGDEAGRRR